MPVKTSGKELKAFMDDSAFWVTDEAARANPQLGLEYTWYDDDEFLVDGHVWDGDVSLIPDAAKVTISAGIVYNAYGKPSREWRSLIAEFKKWRKSQTIIRGSIEFDGSKISKVLVGEALQKLGVKFSF